MGKKKHRQRRKKNDDKHFPESDGSSNSEDELCDVNINDTTLEAGGNKNICNHVKTSVSLPALRKFLRQSKFSPLDCTSCLSSKKPVPSTSSEVNRHVPPDSPNDDLKPNIEADSKTIGNIWMCLQCGHQGCGRHSEHKHALKHFETPRSSSHSLAANLEAWVVWCYTCDDEAFVPSKGKLTECVNYLKKHFNGITKHPESDMMISCHDHVLIEDSRSESVDGGKQTTIRLGANFGQNMKVLPADPSLKRPTGLSNLGNTCFFNAVMQVLTQTPCLEGLLANKVGTGRVRKIFRDACEYHFTQLRGEKTDIDFIEIKEGNSSPLTQALVQFLKGQSDKGKVYNPRPLFGQVCKKSPRFNGHQQQDSQELLRHMIDGVKVEEIRQAQEGILKHFSMNGKVTVKSMSDETKGLIKMYGRQVKHTSVDSLFGGFFISTVLCETCKTPSQILEPFLDISVPVLEEKVFRGTETARKKGRNMPNLDSEVDLKADKVAKPAPAKNSKKGKGKRKHVKLKPTAFGPSLEGSSVQGIAATGGTKASDVEETHAESKDAATSQKLAEPKNVPGSSNGQSTATTSTNVMSNVDGIPNTEANLQDTGTLQKEPHPAPITGNPHLVAGEVRGPLPSESSPLPDGGQVETLCDDVQALHISNSDDAIGIAGQPDAKDANNQGDKDDSSSNSSSHVSRPANGSSSSSCNPQIRTTPNAAEAKDQLEANSAVCTKTSSCGIQAHSTEPSVENQEDHGVNKDMQVTPSLTIAEDQAYVKESCACCMVCDDVSSTMIKGPHGENTHAAHAEDNNCFSKHKCSNIGQPRDSNRTGICTGNPDETNSDVHAQRLCKNEHPLSVPIKSCKEDDDNACTGQIRTTYSIQTNSEGPLCPIPDFNGHLEESERVNDSTVQNGHSDSFVLERETLLCRKGVSEADNVKKAAEVNSAPSQLEGHRQPGVTSGKLPDSDSIESGSVAACKCDTSSESSTKSSSDYESSTEISESTAEITKDVLEARTRAMATLGSRYQPESKECSVKSCLQHFTSAELLMGSNKFGCSFCVESEDKDAGSSKAKADGGTVLRNASKQVLVFQPPAVLTLHLKRFQQNGYHLHKVNRHVDFPDVLDLAPFCSAAAQGVRPGQKQVLYHLYGIIEHAGRMGGGHYTAYVKVRHPGQLDQFLYQRDLSLANLDSVLRGQPGLCNTEHDDSDKTMSSYDSPDSAEEHIMPKPPAGCWYHISDASVTEVSNTARVFNCQAYLLFYERYF